MTRRAGLALAALAAVFAALPLSASAVVQKATPIQPSGPTPSSPAFVGKAAKSDPISGVTGAPQNPEMAPNPTNNVHNDTWMTDDYTQFGGPLGRKPKVFSTSFGRTCITLTFDSRGRIIGSCVNLNEGPALYMFDPVTLDTLAFLQMPFVPPPAGTNPAQNTTGGAYFYLDNRGRIVAATTDRKIFVVGTTEQNGQPAFKKLAEYDPTPCLTAGERMPSVLPDYDGHLWFVGREKGTVGVLDPKTGKCGSTTLGEEIENSFAIGRDGAYIVSDKSMYKLRAGSDLKPHKVWSARYRNDGTQKVGQFNAGSGTTPTLMRLSGHSSTPDLVAITDNANPLNVVVYNAGDRPPKGKRRVVCEVPVFSKGHSADENSLIASGRSLVAENNQGYDLVKFNDIIGGGVQVGGDLSRVSSPGMVRIDVKRDGSGCRRVWSNNSVRPASVVSKASSANGLLYSYENAKDSKGADPWNWVAVSFRTGKVVWKQRAGYGGLYNNHYAGIAIGRRNGRSTLYLGGVGGIMALRDR